MILASPLHSPVLLIDCRVFNRYNDTLEAFTVFADQRYAVGQAVEVSYGRKSSGDLLEQYVICEPTVYCISNSFVCRMYMINY